MPGSREDQYTTHLIIDNEDWGEWDKLEGGERASESTKYRRGGGKPQFSAGGPTSVSNVTISRDFDRDRDNPRIHDLLNKAGRGRARVIKQPMDENWNAFGDPLVYIGTVLTVTPPNHDSMSNDIGMIQVEIDCDDAIA